MTKQDIQKRLQTITYKTINYDKFQKCLDDENINIKEITKIYREDNYICVRLNKYIYLNTGYNLIKN